MNPKLIAILAFLFFVSCVHKQRFPEKLSERIIANSPNVNSLNLNDKGPFDELFTFVMQFNSQDSAFELQNFEAAYNQFINTRQVDLNDAQALPLWIEINGLLLELTGEEKYTKQLEEVSKIDSLADNIKPFILTKRVDHINVNLFEPIEINYNHTLGGEVKIRQETTYPESGSVRLHFGMTERQYIELSIRIPEWAEGTTVVVKNVKYFTKPGSYCFIAKKWKEGDVVEIELPIENYPCNSL
ncbi:glycoside hydrolase family 127 protein [Draconibacterium sp. IB214405]|uniref:beta-L-arabinofuranosidase domain-containing protein n=1 Tax=Draconibacterium sp. IB214405 TaxID=3097352 RepID=UPI002A0EB362|nr:beta-L-arabinofuranosidase domain-containing protein [Draconibacterium sp. IB214405]MDX8339692.1 glycoside hydrolase family 127 protein [Draconibacterium sp. IB214405]